MAEGPHPFPFRTRPLSPPAPMVLGGRPPGRVGRCRNPEFSRARRFGAGLVLTGTGRAASKQATPYRSEERRVGEEGRTRLKGSYLDEKRTETSYTEQY